MTTTEEGNDGTAPPNNRLELLSRTAEWKNVMESKPPNPKQQQQQQPTRVTPADEREDVFSPFSARPRSATASVLSWAASTTSRNSMSFDEENMVPFRSFGGGATTTATGSQVQARPPVAALDVVKQIQPPHPHLSQSQPMFRPRPQPVTSFGPPNHPSYALGSRPYMSTHAAFVPPRSRGHQQQQQHAHPCGSRPFLNHAPPPPYHSSFRHGPSVEPYPPPMGNMYAGAEFPTSGGSAWASRSLGPPPPTLHPHGVAIDGESKHEHQHALQEENRKLREQLEQKNTHVVALQAKVESLEHHIGELRQLPTGKISQIPMEDMLSIMQVYGSEVSENRAPVKRKTETLKKSSVVRTFRRWNPNFLDYFIYQQGKWVPTLGREGELKRRAELKGQATKRKKKTPPPSEQDE